MTNTDNFFGFVEMDLKDSLSNKVTEFHTRRLWMSIVWVSYV